MDRKSVLALSRRLLAQVCVRSTGSDLDEAEIAVQGAISRPPMPESASAELFAVAEKLLPGLEGKAVGGGSDGNFTAALGVPTLDGLGAVGGGAHADHEYLVIEAMAERASLVAGLVNAIQNT